jgi:osmotically inducible protein OsmC
MAERRAHVIWEGDLASGSGKIDVESGAFGELDVTWEARTAESGGKTSPEELIAAAHAACFSMAFSHALSSAGYPPERIEVDAACRFEPIPEGGFKIASMKLDVRASVPGIEQAAFERAVADAESGCPVSNALRGNVQLDVSAALV